MLRRSRLPVFRPVLRRAPGSFPRPKEILSPAPQARFGLDLAHSKGVDALLNQIVRIVRVRRHGTMQFGRGPGKFGKHQHARAVRQPLRRDVFLRDQIEAVSPRGDPHHVGKRVIGDQFLKRDRPEEELQRRQADARKTPVDASDRVRAQADAPAMPSIAVVTSSRPTAQPYVR